MNAEIYNDVNPFLSEKEKEAFLEAEKKYGPLIEKGQLNQLGCAFFLERFSGTLVYEPGENRLYRKNEEKNLWEHVEEAILANELMEVLINFFFRIKKIYIGQKCTLALARNLLVLVKRFCRHDSFFRRDPKEIILHVQNGFLIWNPGRERFDFKPLSAVETRSRNQLNVSYDEKAKAPRFLKELLQPVLSNDDIETLLQYCAQCMLGENLSEKILLIIGVAGSGKSKTINIVESIIGKHNVTQLRTDRLDGSYETNRFIGRHLLTGKDVPPDFLKKRGAHLIKALTGKDALTTEAKHSNRVGEIVGNFNVIITSNSNQPILLQNDREAWGRRILVIHFKKEKAFKPIPNFDEVLLETERSGIFNEILKRLAVLLKNGGCIVPSAEQNRLVENLLDESESTQVFLKDEVEKSNLAEGESQRQCKENLTSEELFLSYQQYCRKRNWTPLPARKFKKELNDLMPAFFHRFRRNDIQRNNTIHRGYYAVRLKNDLFIED